MSENLKNLIDTTPKSKIARRRGYLTATAAALGIGSIFMIPSVLGPLNKSPQGVLQPITGIPTSTSGYRFFKIHKYEVRKTWPVSQCLEPTPVKIELSLSKASSTGAPTGKQIKICEMTRQADGKYQIMKIHSGLSRELKHAGFSLADYETAKRDLLTPIRPTDVMAGCIISY